MTKLVLCDIPNTLFDSRHRTEDYDLCMTDTMSDAINYSTYSLIRDLAKVNYQIIYTHYCLHRLRPTIERMLSNVKLNVDNLHTNYNTQEVYSNQTLKKYVFEKVCKNSTFEYVIDNDETMQSYWMNNDVRLLNVPLPR